MRSDEIFYRVFQQAPTRYFELIGESAETAAGYKFTAEELKHAGLRLDGLFVPKRAGAPVHFVEAFTYKTEHAYSNLFAKVFLWLETHNPLQDWRACVIFASRALEPANVGPYHDLLHGGRVKRVFLDELVEPAEDQFGLGILELIGCPAAETLPKAKTWVQRVARANEGRQRLAGPGPTDAVPAGLDRAGPSSPHAVHGSLQAVHPRNVNVGGSPAFPDSESSGPAES